ncbi:MAG TPA: DUF2066 domain-containing protein [Gammaproteobacteria bacterium]|nr:DUF2066 domain-containing protein [Gammaproteobacteria bacterium]
MLKILLTILFILFPPQAMANKLFFDKCLLNTQEKNPMHTCFSTALSNILIRTSGHSDITKSENVKLALQQPDQYVHTYKKHHSNGNEYIEVSFKKSTIQTLIKETPYKIWNNLKPTTMFWVFLDTTNQLITQQKPYAKTLLKQAKLRGIEIILPIDDIETEQLIRDIDTDAIQTKLWKASQRYQIDNTVIALIQKDAHGYKSQWSLINQYRQLNWEQPANDLSALLQDSIDHLMDQYATESSTPKPILSTFKPFLLEISNIENYSNLTQTVHQLRTLKNINKITLKQAQKNHILLSITGSTSDVELEKNINQLETLTPAVNSPIFTDAIAHLKFIHDDS